MSNAFEAKGTINFRSENIPNIAAAHAAKVAALHVLAQIVQPKVVESYSVSLNEPTIFPETHSESVSNTPSTAAENTTLAPAALSNTESKSFYGEWSEYLYDSASSFKTNYLDTLSKEQVDGYLVKSIGFSAYYTLVGAANLENASAFITRAEVSMGLKVFGAIANPIIAHFVESITDNHINNAKYMYYSGKCYIEGEQCEELAALSDRFKAESMQDPTLVQDCVQFTYKYINEVSAGLEELTVKDLLSTGILSATATNIRDVVYDAVGLTPYMQGYFAKNWLNFYAKDGIKDGLRSILKATSDKVQDCLGLKDVVDNSTLSNSNALSMDDIITPQSNNPIIMNNAESFTPFLSLAQTIMASLPSITTETVAI